jgi:phage gpG-like protein
MAKQIKFNLSKQEISKIKIKVTEHSMRFFLANYSKEGTDMNGFVRWSKRKKDTGKRILYDTGNMKKSFKIVNQSSSKAKIINTADYSGFHQNGTDVMPARQIMYKSKTLDKEVEKLIIKEIDKIFSK